MVTIVNFAGPGLGISSPFLQGIVTDLQGRGKTVLAVTHDDRYDDCCDRLIRWESDRMIAKETPVPAGGENNVNL